jgi:hypothetical protein
VTDDELQKTLSIIREDVMIVAIVLMPLLVLSTALLLLGIGRIEGKLREQHPPIERREVQP